MIKEAKEVNVTGTEVDRLMADETVMIPINVTYRSIPMAAETVFIPINVSYRSIRMAAETVTVPINV